MTKKNVVDFTSVKAAKEFIETANQRIFELEHVLYSILDTDRLGIAKELAADVLGEDLDIYNEEDKIEELDFENDCPADFDSWESDDV